MIKLKPEKFFIYCALIFGVILMLIIPPFQSPDEDSHFKRAYVISQGKLYPTVRDGIIGFELPAKMIKYINDKLQFIGNTERKYSYSELLKDDRLPEDYGEKTFQNFSTVPITPVAYMIPALGIFFSRIINAILGLDNISFVNMLYFARFFSLVFYIIVIAFAIKITPILKKTFCLIGLIPMSLSLAVAISYDSILIEACLLATALIFKLIFDEDVKKVSYKYLIVFGVIGFILLSIKTVYITVLLPIIFVPKEKFGKNMFNKIKSFCIIGGIALTILIINKIPNLLLEKVENIESQFFYDQIIFVISHPIYYLKIWINTMITNRNFYISGMVGTFGLLDTYLITVFTGIYIIAFLAIFISDISLLDKKFDLKYKIISLIGIIATVSGIFLAMYVMWTSIIEEYGVGASSITGVQGRYFLPLIPLGIALFSNNVLKKNKKIEKILNQIIENSYIVSIIVLIITIMTILLRFWC